jgi:hypothetical protein
MLKLLLLLLVSNALGQLTGSMKQNVELDMELAVCSGAQNCQTGENLASQLPNAILARRLHCFSIAYCPICTEAKKCQTGE